MNHKDNLQKLAEHKIDDGLFIDTNIPYEPGGEVGQAYNRYMENADDWVLFLDQDVFLCNPNWYEICLDAIRFHGNEAGWITCWTNRIGRTEQKHPDAPESNDIEEHRQFAKKLWDENGVQVTDITDMGKDLGSGFFMLTNKMVWRKVGGFKDGFLGVDNDYHVRIRNHGFKMLRLDGLYVYHHYSREWFW